jgi:hypothetical protein
MKVVMWLCIFSICVLLVGCTVMERVAPSQYDAEGNRIPGTHELAYPYKPISDSIPYADVIVGIGLLAWNGYERYRKNKYKDGLWATVKAIEAAGNDPATKAEIANLKEELNKAHTKANVQPIISNMLSKL